MFAVSSLPTKISSGIKEVPCPVSGLEGDCWIWQRYIDPQGYGRYNSIGVYKVVYELLVGPRMPGLTIDHLCRVRSCCNPMHLEQVTSRVNTLRGNTIVAENAKKTHYLYGHPFDAGNTTLIKEGGVVVERKCRACHKNRRATDAYRRYWKEYMKGYRRGLRRRDD